MTGGAGPAAYCGPFPIVNTALNIVKGRELAWQTRKAASFMFTPLYSGFQSRSSDPGAKECCYRPTRECAQPEGMSLGIPLAISGAAASPNQGYHTSPGLAFLMTVFNVRLGRWCGNTAAENAWRERGPVFSNHYLFRELLADTNETSRFLYLSDGGHFENLGIYELVRRRCAVVVACDAGCDRIRGPGERHPEVRDRPRRGNHHRRRCPAARGRKRVVPAHSAGPSSTRDRPGREPHLHQELPRGRSRRTSSTTSPSIRSFRTKAPRTSGSTNRSSKATAGSGTTRSWRCANTGTVVDRGIAR